MIKLPELTDATFIQRRNRFIAQVELPGGQAVDAHLANTGRMRELLIPGRAVKIAPAHNPARKTRYDLFLIDQDGAWVCLRAAYANELADRWLASGLLAPYGLKGSWRREMKIGRHRFDFFLEAGDKPTILEVKSANFKKGHTALFPDAPTVRGRQHVESMLELAAAGYRCVLLMITMGQAVDELIFNRQNDAPLADAMAQAKAAGLDIIVMKSRFTETEAFFDGFLPIDWGRS